MYLNTLSCKLITMHVASKDKNMPCKIFIMRGQAKVATIIGNKMHTRQVLLKSWSRCKALNQ